MPFGHVECFNISNDNWDAYVRRVEQYIKVNSINNDLKVATLVTVVGPECYELMCDLCSPANPETRTFEELVRLVKEHLEPQRSEIAERHVFRQRTQRQGESVRDYLQALKHLAKTCNFSTYLEVNLRDQFVSGLYNEDMRSRIFAEKSIDYKRAVELALALEAAERHAATACAPGAAGSARQAAPPAVADDGLHRFGPGPGAGAARADARQRSCGRCGKAGHVDGRCRFKHYTCDNCGQKGHLKVMCKAKSAVGGTVGKKTARGKHTKSTTRHSSATILTACKYAPSLLPGSRSTQTNVVDDNDDKYNLSQDTQTHQINENKHEEESNRDDKNIVSLYEIVQKHSDILSRTSYIDRLSGQIQDVFIPYTNEIGKQQRLDVVKNFVDKIADLLVYINDGDYGDKVKYEIGQCLSDLQLSQPEQERSKEGVKNCLSDLLFKCINTFNEQWISSSKEKAADHNSKICRPNDNDDYTNEPLDNSIIDWVESNLQISTEYDVVTDTLIRRVKSILEFGINTKNNLKAEIMNVLEEISQHLYLPKNKTKYLDKLATDLTKFLYYSRVERYRLRKHNSKSKLGLRNEAKFDETLSNPKFNEKIEDDIVNQITDVLFGNIDVVLHENRHDVVKDIRRILKDTGEFSSVEALNLAKTLLGNVRYEYYSTKDFNTRTTIHKPSSSYIILTSEHELSTNSGPRFHSTPSNQILNVDENVNEFITKFIQNNYIIDDDMVKNVLKVILKQEIHKLSPSAKKKLYENNISDVFNTEKFQMELEIVKEVCSWLKKMPFYYRFLQPGPETTEFVHGLARNITEIEVERSNYPNRMDYDSWLHTEIAVYMLQKEEEMSDEDKFKIGHSAEQLCLQIINLRKDDKESNELTKIIEEHLKKFDNLLAADYMKKILWHRRLGEELVRMLHENPTASSADARNRLKLIPIPRDESVLKFKIEMKYDIVIHDWLDTFALLPSQNHEEEMTRKNMIKELSQKIIETDQRSARDDQADVNLDGYIADWISNLNLDPTVSVDVPMKISQLRSALESIKWTQSQRHSSDVHIQGPIDRSRRKSKLQDHRPLELGEQMVEAIEDWCNNLPIEENDQDGTKARKEQVATKIFQVVGSLSDNPEIAHDYQKFRDMLANEIDAQLQNLSNYAAVNANKDSIKHVLLDKIMEIKKKILDVTAGDDYVQVLEKSIDASMYNSRRSSKKNDPEYELFKKRMVMLWLLQNYDYAVDFHSLKYKKILSEDIHFLSEECQNRNVFPAAKEDMMRDIMSAFYMAQPPNEDAIMDEVENVKMRCEIEQWAKELPLRETNGFKKLLERDQVLTILTKILFDIENSGEYDSDEKMKREIIKWVEKLPLITAEKNNLSAYADLLICTLKASVNSRKCQRQAEPQSPFALQQTLNNLKRSDEHKGILSAPKENENNASIVAGPSMPRSCGQECAVSKAKNDVLITTAINNWCHQLPLQFSNPNEQLAVQKTKQQISQRLLQFVCELHYRPNTLNNEGLYEHYLNNEIENILIKLTKQRLYWEAQRERNNRKYQIIAALKAIRPLVKEEKDRENYKEKLKHTISSFHESMAPYSAAQLSTSAQNSILEDFMQYKNHNDFEGKELYKSKINDALNNEMNDQGGRIDPLLATNKLICELSKVKATKPAQREMTQTDAKRRFSQPNPLDFNRPPATQKRYSLPHPLSQTAFPRFPPQTYPYQNEQEMPLPFPLHQTAQGFSPIAVPEIRPYPLPAPPPLNFSDSNPNQSHRSGPQFAGQRNIRPDLIVTEPTFNELQQPENDEQNANIQRERLGRASTRSTARVPNSTRSFTECPEEQRRNRQDERWRKYEFCQTCDSDRDCDFNVRRPYPLPMDYMYD